MYIGFNKDEALQLGEAIKSAFSDVFEKDEHISGMERSNILYDEYLKIITSDEHNDFMELVNFVEYFARVIWTDECSNILRSIRTHLGIDFSLIFDHTIWGDSIAYQLGNTVTIKSVDVALTARKIEKLTDGKVTDCTAAVHILKDLMVHETLHIIQSDCYTLLDQRSRKIYIETMNEIVTYAFLLGCITEEIYYGESFNNSIISAIEHFEASQNKYKSDLCPYYNENLLIATGSIFGITDYSCLVEYIDNLKNGEDRMQVRRSIFNLLVRNYNFDPLWFAFGSLMDSYMILPAINLDISEDLILCRPLDKFFQFIRDNQTDFMPNCSDHFNTKKWDDLSDIRNDCIYDLEQLFVSAPYGRVLFKDFNTLVDIASFQISSNGTLNMPEIARMTNYIAQTNTIIGYRKSDFFINNSIDDGLGIEIVIIMSNSYEPIKTLCDRDNTHTPTPSTQIIIDTIEKNL